MQNWTRWAILAAVVVGIIVVVKWLGGKASDAIDAKNPKVSLYAWVVTGLMAVTFILAAKVVFTKFPVPGITETIHAV